MTGFGRTAGCAPNVDTAEPDVRIHAFLRGRAFCPLPRHFRRSRCSSADGGERQGDAPLRENLAAGILALTGWRPGVPLLDPMCGSGTLLVEAAMMALQHRRQARAHSALQKLRGFDARLVGVRATRTGGSSLPRAGAGDLRRRSLRRAAQAGARQPAGRGTGGDGLSSSRPMCWSLPAPAESGVIVTNPPYGVRVGEQQELAAFYPKLGDALKAKYTGWSAWIFTGDLRLPKLIGLKPSRRIPLYNGRAGVPALRIRDRRRCAWRGAGERVQGASAKDEARQREVRAGLHPVTQSLVSYTMFR